MEAKARLAEADTFLRENDELRGVLNSGHSKKTATVWRSVGDNHEPTAFSTWAPKAIAMIGRLPDTLEDRSVVVGMRRRAPGEHVERLRLDRIDEEVSGLRQRMMRWAADHTEGLRQGDPAVPTGIVSDRARDNWRPRRAGRCRRSCGRPWFGRESRSVRSWPQKPWSSVGGSRRCVAKSRPHRGRSLCWWPATRAQRPDGASPAASR